MPTPTAQILKNLFNSPNPFCPQRGLTMIRESLREDMAVDVEYFNYLGNRLLRRHYDSGTEGGRQGANRIAWDGRDSRGIVSGSGGYICRITVTSPIDGAKKGSTRKIGVIWER